MNRIKSFVNNYVLKKRYVFSLRNIDNITVGINKNEFQQVVLTGNSILENKHMFKTSKIQKNILKRSKIENLFCLVCINNDKTVLGYFWGIAPKKTIWHDSIYIKRNQGFLFNGFVNPNFRGKNLFPYLIYEASLYMKKQYGVEEVIDVVEHVNIASVKSHYKVNANVYSNNFLIKVFGRNLISIYRGRLNLLTGKKRKSI